MITVLCLNKYFAPAKCLVDYFSENGVEAEILSWNGEERRKNYIIRKLNRRMSDPTSLLVRYGCTALAEYDQRFAKVLNPAKTIKAASGNKFKALGVMEGKGLPVIPCLEVDDFWDLWVDDTEDESSWVNGIIIARKFQHFGGKDIKVLHLIESHEDDPDPLRGFDYVMPLIPRTKEYRVWVFHSKSYKPEGKARPLSVKIAEKVDNGSVDHSTQDDSKRIVKNHKNGYSFVYHDQIPDEVRELGKQAVDTFGLDFGAVDIMEDLDTGHFYILEVNTAPGCVSNSTMSALGNKFITAHGRLGMPTEE